MGRLPFLALPLRWVQTSSAGVSPPSSWECRSDALKRQLFLGERLGTHLPPASLPESIPDICILLSLSLQGKLALNVSRVPGCPSQAVPGGAHPVSERGLFKMDGLEPSQHGQLLHPASIRRHHWPCPQSLDGLWDSRMLSFLGSYRAMADLHYSGSEVPFEPGPPPRNS